MTLKLYIVLYNLNNLVLYYFCGSTLPCYLQARIFRRGLYGGLMCMHMLGTDFWGYLLNTFCLAAVAINIYIKLMYSSFLQAHFGIDSAFEPSNTTLLEWAALGLLPVNRVSVKVVNWLMNIYSWCTSKLPHRPPIIPVYSCTLGLGLISWHERLSSFTVTKFNGMRYSIHLMLALLSIVRLNLHRERDTQYILMGIMINSQNTIVYESNIHYHFDHC